MLGFDPTALIANVPALMIGFAFHEYAHAWMADRLGDPTPRSMGRLTLNPLAHLDIFGTLMALLYRFGWAKPVQINPRYFKGNPLRGRMLVALAGPVANLIVAFLAMFVWVLVLQWTHSSSWSPVLSQVFMAIVLMNLGLGVFNLLPIPPLDGFAVLTGILPGRYAARLWALESYGMILLALVLFTDIVGRILYPVVGGLFDLYKMLAVLILTPFFR